VIATSLFAACGLALLTVFVLLAFLAVVMHLITEAFPLKDEGLDSAIVAAISGTVAAIIPGARVTRIEEEK
jgi:hypothetical protein